MPDAEKDVTHSVQTRCPRMREHMYRAEPLPMPCADCYSLRVTCERLPEWQPEVRWHSVIPPQEASMPDTEKDACCVLCSKPREDWPCGASWDGEHRPLTKPIPLDNANDS